jgi:DNA-binding response OmpR family regulator
MRILIAEDDAASRVLLEATLKKLGHEVITTADGRSAWEAYQRGGIYLVISDWMMPEVDGLALCRLIRGQARSRYTYIILLTALGGKGRYLEGMEAGADDFIAKPFDRDELQARLRVAERILSLQAEVNELEGLLPICSYCKKIREGDSTWVQIEQYINERTDASFSHGICPECYETRVKAEIAQWERDRGLSDEMRRWKRERGL